MFEGGSLLRLAPGLAAYGLSRRCDAEGARQLADVLRWLEIELIEVPLTGYSFHLDGALALVDRDLALVRPELLPYDFLADLERRGFELLYADRDEGWAVNLLTLAPRRVVISDAVPRTAERLAAAGVEVLTLPYDEVHKNGGGIHCSTNELVRDPA
jgi:N-dimethylarginine dimethylaminohydrolase